MVSNVSSNEKTVKLTLQSASSDSWSIDHLITFGNYLGKSIMPNGIILDDFLDYFDQYLVDVDVDEKFYYQPAAFSNYYYGTPDLDFLIMYFARISTMFDFNQPKIRILPLSRLKDINQLMVAYKKTVEDSAENPESYTKIQDVEVSKKAYL
jgi:hypothetical protein